MQKILVVDDDVDMLLMLKNMFTKAGYLIRTLNSGKTVLPVIHSFHPDLVILDINLGDADGRELCHQIKCLENFKHIPIILFSAEDFPNLNIADCKADAFVVKPFSAPYMLAIVKKLIVDFITSYPVNSKSIQDAPS